MKFKSICLIALSLACNSVERRAKAGHDIAEQKCSSCHAFVPADVLDRKTWLQHVLPEMSLRSNVKAEEWEQIRDYYYLMAPDSLPRSVPPQKILRDNWIFKVLTPNEKILPYAITTLVKIDSARNTIYSGDGQGYLLRWDKNLQPFDTLLLRGASSALFMDHNNHRKGVFTEIGELGPNNSDHGNFLQFDLEGKKAVFEDSVATKLPRPVASAVGDFNNDGLDDYLIGGFGHDKGALYIARQQPDGHFTQEVLLGIPGTAQIQVQDFNNDGWQDFMALFSQAEESVRLFLNNQDGTFTIKTLLTFLPVSGSTSFQVVDINADGSPDIIYTCGDNSDFSKIFKPFHGLYIYLNEGDFNYKETFFFPINGCSKAIAADLDNDGDLDIATIAFFADLNDRPEEKCILFEQDGPMHFIPHSPNIDTEGRWLCIDINDYDGDGKPDIILGNFSTGFINVPVMRNKWDRELPFLILKNDSPPSS